MDIKIEVGDIEDRVHIQYENNKFKSRHCQRLMSLCRTCGNKIKISGRYKYPKAAVTYVSIIQQLFRVNILEDIDLVHPKSICDNCRKKLDMYNRSMIQYEPVKPLIDYSPHTDTDCFVCTIRTRKVEGIHLTAKEKHSKESIWLTERFVKTKCKEYSLHDMTSVMNYNDNLFCIAKVIPCNNIPTITFSATVQSNGSWSINAYYKVLKNITSIPSKLDSSNFHILLNFINCKHICVGNKDLPELISKKTIGGTFQDSKGSVVASIENYTFIDINAMNTIRHRNCEIVVDNENQRCSVCTEYRKTLNTLNWRLKQPKVTEDVNKHTRNTYLSREQLEDKTVKLNQEVKSLRRSVGKYEQFIASIIVEKEGEVLPTELHDSCEVAIKDNQNELTNDSPQFLLQEQQKKQTSYKNRPAISAAVEVMKENTKERKDDNQDIHDMPPLAKRQKKEDTELK